jgi:hypothetical protein
MRRGGGQGRVGTREERQEVAYHDDDDDGGEDGGSEYGEAAAGGPSQAGDGTESQQAASTEQMVGKLVRLALACEYSRQPIRRADIVTKGK